MVLRGFEEGGILGVGTRPAPFDVVHPESVQFLGDTQFVQHAEVDTLALRAVPEGGVVEGQERSSWHGGEWRIKLYHIATTSAS